MNTYPFGTYDTVNKIFVFNPDFDKPIEAGENVSRQQEIDLMKRVREIIISNHK
mgnify:CR=1 FL=1